MTKLQLALDFGTKDEIQALLAELSGMIDILEIGTPLIIREGIRFVTEIKQTFPATSLLADLKIMDAGDIEAKMAYEAGADLVTVLGAANDFTIAAAVRAASATDKKIMADLINVRDIQTRARQIEQLGVAYLCVHTATDSQRQGLNPLAELEEVSRVVPPHKIAVAGGIDEALLPRILSYRPAVAIVGSAVTTSADPKNIALRLKKILEGA